MPITSPFLINSPDSWDHVSYCHHLAYVVHLPVNFYILIFFSEITGPIVIKVG